MYEALAGRKYVHCHFKEFHTYLQLPSTVSSPSAIVSLYIIKATFNLTHPSRMKSEFEVHARYIVIIERFENRSNANIFIQLILILNQIFLVKITKLM